MQTYLPQQGASAYPIDLSVKGVEKHNPASKPYTKSLFRAVGSKRICGTALQVVYRHYKLLRISMNYTGKTVNHTVIDA